MSHLESLERKLREMSENGNSLPGDSGGNYSETPTASNGAICDLKTPRKFVRVLGYDGRCNDLVYCKPLTSSTHHTPSEEDEISVDSDSSNATATDDDTRQKCMIYFGGDMQDFAEMMDHHKEHKGYLCWNLEATASLLQKQFPNHHIVVVRPSRIQIMTFSCFDNFVNSASSTGVPDHVINHGSLQHLELLLKNLSDRIEKSQEQDKILAKQIASVVKTEEGESEVSSTTTELAEEGTTNGFDKTDVAESDKPFNPHLERSKISLVGFSKGCVVLNQFMYEFHYLKTLTPDDRTMEPFVSCVEDMYWLDGGHNGGLDFNDFGKDASRKTTWITSRSLIETLVRQNIRIHVHMTPYQLSDDRRPWLRKEEKIFSDWLKRFNAPIKRYVHFDNEPGSLQQHFRLIGMFGTAEKTMEPEGNSIDDSQLDTRSTTFTGVLGM